MRSLLHIVPFAGLAALGLAGCQTYQNPAPQPVYSQPAPVQSQPVPARAQPVRQTPKPVYDPVNDDPIGGGGGGGGGGSPGGGGGGSWG